jgi:hypothetical protein
LNVQFHGEITDLKQGIEQIKHRLGIRYKKNGVHIAVVRNENCLEITGNNGKYQIAYNKRTDFFRLRDNGGLK